MKFATLSSLLLSGLVRGLPEAQRDITGGKLAGCFFAKAIGQGTSLSNSGTETFNVVAGAEVRCFTGCISGGEFTTSYAIGSITDGATENNEYCESTTKFRVDADYTSLDWTLTTNSDEFFGFGITCFCTDDGSTLTLDNGQGILDDINGLGCFSEDSIVQVRGKGDVAMKDLELGDHVLTGKTTYEPVYTFGHRKPDHEMVFYEITTDESSLPLAMTGNHMVMKVDAKGKIHATRADQLVLGDQLLHVESNRVASVTLIKTTKKKGLYMPLTPSGHIVVGGILASNYISISDTAPGVVNHSQFYFPMNEQTLSHWWMSPVRMLCMGVSSSFCSNGFDGSSAYEVQEGDDGILPWLLMGRHFAHVAENQPTLVRFMLGVPTFLLFGTFTAIEHVFVGPSYAPFLFVMLVVGLVMLKKKFGGDGDSDFARSAGYGLLSSNV